MVPSFMWSPYESSTLEGIKKQILRLKRENQYHRELKFVDFTEQRRKRVN